MSDDSYESPYELSNSSEHFEQIAMGNIKGASRTYKFGYNDLVGTSEVLVSHDGIYGLPTTAETVTVTSSSLLDVPSGTGARSITIQGLSADYELQTETIELNGTSLFSYLRVFRAYVEESGNILPIDGANDGDITITQSTSAIAMVRIAPSDGQTLCACYTVPVGYTAYIWSIDSTVGAGKECEVKIKTREYNGTNSFRVKGVRNAYQNTVGQVFAIPSKIIEKTDIVITGKATQSDVTVSATFLMEIIKD